jgi:hypothetical protein
VWGHGLCLDRHGLCLNREEFLFTYAALIGPHVCRENIDGKEIGEAAGLDETGHSYTQDPRAREDKDHGNRTPTEAERGSAVYAGI